MLLWDASEWFTCADCRGCWVDQVPFSEPSELYGEDYYGQDPGRTANDWWDFSHGSNRQFRWILSQIQKRLPAGRLLDIGCGGGFFLALCREAGYRIAGVELARQAREKAHQVLAIDIASTPVEECGFEIASFDVVSMNNVLEHVPDPLGTLLRVHGLLRPGGVLTVSVPNANFGRFMLRTIAPLSAPLRLGNPIHSMAVFDARVHVYAFSPTALDIVLRGAGFSDVELFNEVPVLNWKSPIRNAIKLAQFGVAVLLRPMLGPKRLTGHGITAFARRV